MGETLRDDERNSERENERGKNEKEKCEENAQKVLSQKSLTKFSHKILSQEKAELASEQHAAHAARAARLNPKMGKTLLSQIGLADIRFTTRIR